MKCVQHIIRLKSSKQPNNNDGSQNANEIESDSSFRFSTSTVCTSDLGCIKKTSSKSEYMPQASILQKLYSNVHVQEARMRRRMYNGSQVWKLKVFVE